MHLSSVMPRFIFGTLIVLLILSVLAFLAYAGLAVVQGGG